MSEHMIDVCSCACKIQAYRLAKNIWMAAGEYLGEHLRTRDSSAARATLAWRKAAEFNYLIVVLETRPNIKSRIVWV